MIACVLTIIQHMHTYVATYACMYKSCQMLCYVWVGLMNKTRPEQPTKYPPLHSSLTDIDAYVYAYIDTYACIKDKQARVNERKPTIGLRRER